MSISPLPKINSHVLHTLSGLFSFLLASFGNLLHLLFPFSNFFGPSLLCPSPHSTLHSNHLLIIKEIVLESQLHPRELSAVMEMFCTCAVQRGGH